MGYIWSKTNYSENLENVISNVKDITDGPLFFANIPIFRVEKNSGVGIIIILCRKIVIFPEPNLYWTSDQSVKLSLSDIVQ